VLSIRLLIDKGIITCFDDQKCLPYSQGHKKIVAEGLRNKRNGLYQLSTLNQEIRANLTQIDIDKAHLWHYYKKKASTTTN